MLSPEKHSDNLSSPLRRLTGTNQTMASILLNKVKSGSELKDGNYKNLIKGEFGEFT